VANVYWPAAEIIGCVELVVVQPSIVIPNGQCIPGYCVFYSQLLLAVMQYTHGPRVPFAALGRAYAFTARAFALLPRLFAGGLRYGSLRTLPLLAAGLGGCYRSTLFAALFALARMIVACTHCLPRVVTGILRTPFARTRPLRTRYARTGCRATTAPFFIRRRTLSATGAFMTSYWRSACTAFSLHQRCCAAHRVRNALANRAQRTPLCGNERRWRTVRPSVAIPGGMLPVAASR